MNVLSLFDGMSCGQIALERAGIKVTNYFASEIDKYAIQVTKANYPNTIHIGDVTKVSYKNGVIYTENGEYNVGKINLVMGGSPCQGFSFAGKQLNFKDPRSALFFEWLRICQEVCPDYFLLENVKMKKESEDVITDRLGVEPILINSALVSAQNRKRLFWTNIPNVTQPEDRGFFLKDIIENGFVDREKALAVTTRVGGATADRYLNKSMHQMVCVNILESEYSERSKSQIKKNGKFPNQKSVAVCTNSNMTGSGVNCITNDGINYRKLTPVECERLQTVPDNYTNYVSTTQRYRMLGNGWTVDVIAHIFKSIKNE